MASIIRTATPPPPAELRTPPPAPRFGTYEDGWAPHIRKSARISSQRVPARTPSPHFPSSRRSPAQSSKQSARSDNSSMASPEMTPYNQRKPAPDYVRRAQGRMNRDQAATGSKDKSTRGALFSAATHMLPTPSKTPQKPPSQETAAQIGSIARNIFPSEDADILAPRAKRPKHYTGMTLESFTATEVEDPIAIFTDSQDRIPERDEDPSNPFNGSTTSVPAPVRSRSKRQTVRIPGEGLVPLDEATKRDDGMVFTFRGKKFWRKASAAQSHSEDESAETSASRSRTKGRLLFPKHKTEEMMEDEEATTDMEDHLSDTETPPQTPTKVHKGGIKTPRTPRFAPVSPPSTKRTTRATNKLVDEDSPMTGAAKRAGELMAQSRTKRARS